MVALLDGEGDVLQNGAVGAVVEADVVEYDLAVDGIQTDGIGGLHHLGNLIQHLKHTHGGVHGVGYHIGEVGEEAQRAEDHARVAHVDRQFTVGHGFAHNLKSRKSPHGVAGACDEDGDDGEDEHGHLLGVQIGLVKLGGVVVEAVGLAVLLSEGLDHANARQGVVHHGVHGGGAPPLVGVALPQLGQGEFQDQHHGDDGGVEDEGQLPVDAEEQDRQHDVGDHVADEVGHAVNEEAADALGVVVDAVDELTRGVAVKIGEGQLLHGAEDVVLHVSRDAGGKVGVGAVLNDADAHGEQSRARQHTHPNVYVLFRMHGARGANDLVVQDGTADDGGEQGQARGGQQAEQNDDHLLFEHHEVVHESSHDALLADTMLADPILGIHIHAPAFGTGAIELLEDAVVVGYGIAAVQSFPQGDEGQQLQLDAVGAVTQHDGGAAAVVGALRLLELLVGHVSLFGGEIVRGMTVSLQAVGGGVVVDVGLGQLGKREALQRVSCHAVEITVGAGKDQPALSVVSLHVQIHLQAHVDGGGVDALGFQQVRDPIGHFFKG